MPQLLSLGKIVPLDDVVRLFADRISAAGLEGCGPFREWLEQILVNHPEKSALMLDASVRIDGDLDLEVDLPPFADGISCVVAPDDLTVAGFIYNADLEDGPALLVGGNLKVGEMVMAASTVIVVGACTVERLVLCDGDNGVFLVGGQLSAQGLIDCDHEILIAGDVKATVASDDLGNMRDLLVAEVFEDPDDPANEWPEGDLIRQRLLAGLPVFKPGAT
jgi:hypothetical protein